MLPRADQVKELLVKIKEMNPKWRVENDGKRICFEKQVEAGVITCEIGHEFDPIFSKPRGFIYLNLGPGGFIDKQGRVHCSNRAISLLPVSEGVYNVEEDIKTGDFLISFMKETNAWREWMKSQTAAAEKDAVYRSNVLNQFFKK